MQERFAKRYGIGKEEYEGVFDHLLEDDEVFAVGELQVKAIHLPGHTPDHMGYLVGGMFFSLSFLFSYQYFFGNKKRKPNQVTDSGDMKI